MSDQAPTKTSKLKSNVSKFVATFAANGINAGLLRDVISPGIGETALLQ
jgi:hypothetical protein